MSEITLAPDTWAAWLQKPTAAGRAAIIASLFSGGGSVEFRAADNSLIRTVTFGAWAVGAPSDGVYPVLSGEYVDTESGSGSPAVAVFKNAADAEVFRCSCGVGSGFYKLLAAIESGVPIQRGGFALGVVPREAEPGEPDGELVVVEPQDGYITVTQGETYDLTPHIIGGTPPYSFAGVDLPEGVTVSAAGILAADEDAPTSDPDNLDMIEVDVVDSVEPPEVVLIPTNTTAPKITGVAKVGEVLTISNGVWSGSPTNYVPQWRRGSAVIPGEMGSTYTLVSIDVGQMIGGGVVAGNSAGASAVALAAAVGPVVAAEVLSPPAWTTSPTISGATTAGSTLVCSDGVVTGNPAPLRAFQWLLGGNPIPGADSNAWLSTEGASVTCRVTATNSQGVATVTTAAFGPITAYVPPVAGELPEFGITSMVGGTNLPFAFGHVFKKGDVPAGQYVNTSLTDWQCTPLNTWPDGSLRIAVIAGRTTCAAGVTKQIQLTGSSSNRSGAALTEANLASALPTTTLKCGAETINLGSLVGTAALHKTVVSGPVMSNFIYRKQLSGSNHLVAYFDVRLYKGGAVEIFPWIENGYLYVANPINDVRTYTLTIGGDVKYTVDLDSKVHTRVALIDNTAADFKHWSYWSVADPQIEPKHDTRYMQESGMVPNYGFAPYEYVLAKVPQTFAPGALGLVSAQMGTTGHMGYVGILPPWAADHIASGGDPRAYRSVMLHGLSSGSWPIHYRDETTQEPFLPSTYPQIWISPGKLPVPPKGTGGGYRNYGGTAAPDTAHQPSLVYLPYLLTGRQFFLDELLFWCTWSMMAINYQQRGDADNLQILGQERARARILRGISQTWAALDDDHPHFPDVKNMWEKNMDVFERRYVLGTSGSGWKNNLGWMGLYSSGGGSPYFNSTNGGYWWASNWMMQNIVVAIGCAWNLELPQSADSKASHKVVRDFGYRIPINMAGDGSPGTFDYRRFASFQLPIGRDNSGFPPETWQPDWGAMYSVVQTNGKTGIQAPAPIPSGSKTMYLYHQTYDQSPLSSSNWSSHSAVIYNWAALSLAVEHGVPGAAAGFSRLTGSDSWGDTKSGYGAVRGFKDNPTWGYWPRTLSRPE